MKTAVILAAGIGSKIWPYSVIRPKVMIPLANKPIIEYLIITLKEMGFENIIIAAGNLGEQIENYFRLESSLQIIKTGSTSGTADTLSRISEFIEDDDFLVLYGDTYIEKEDIAKLIRLYREKGISVLVEPLKNEPSRDWICCNLHENTVENILGHPRDDATHRFCAFAFNKRFLEYIDVNSGIFTSVQVGMMPPEESYIEMSLQDYIEDGGVVYSAEAERKFFDIDKPWHILMANYYVVDLRCGELTENHLEKGASIDGTADLRGFVRLGENSHIGKNVKIKGNIIVGKNTIIENGAIINGNAVIGSDCYIGNYCYINNNSAIGNRCVINHCAEFEGIIMENVYLYHYMEFYGIIGQSTDLGAATVCGTLRFDDGETSHRVKGRKEHPKYFSNATFLGDFSRTGVNTIIMPGCKIGVYSIVGPGVILTEDVPDNTIVMAEQKTVKREWGPNRYGW